MSDEIFENKFCTYFFIKYTRHVHKKNWEGFFVSYVRETFFKKFHLAIIYEKPQTFIKYPQNLCENWLFKQKRRERGRIDVRGVKLVEPAILHGEGGDAHAPNVM